MTAQPAAPTAAASALPRMFLRTAWYHLTMLNFPADPVILRRYVPAGTELDFWQGRAYVSLVGFRMQDTRVLGVPIPWHRNFEEVNLRFYVRRQDPTGWRRGVVFIKEIVPRRMIAWVARRFYNEKTTSRCRCATTLRCPAPHRRAARCATSGTAPIAGTSCQPR